MTEVDPDRRQLAALYKHWVVADSVNHHLRRSVKAGADDRSGLPDATTQVAQHVSVLATITVWYALLYVVVEGYCKLGCRNPEIDRLLAEGSHVEALRRFRNATFHFQAEPLPPKLMTFLMTRTVRSGSTP